MKYFITLLALCGFALAGHFCIAQQPTANITYRSRLHQITEWEWIKQPWAGDSLPYVRVKQRINAAFANKKQIEVVTQKYREAAQAKPLDPVAQYAFGYAAYEGRPLDLPVNGRELIDVALALGDPKSPKTYEYDRLRFAITVRWRPYSQLKPLGYRLLKRNPDDYDVKKGMVNILVAGSADEQKQAMKYAQELVQKFPTRSGSYSSLGWVYEIQSVLRKDISLGDKAIVAYRKAIALSKSSTTRQSVQSNIDRIQQKQAQIRAN